MTTGESNEPTKTIHPGDEVYDEDGNAWEYVSGTIDGRHIVRAIYESGHRNSNVRELISVWTEPPIQRRHEEFARTLGKIVAKREELQALRLELAEAERRRDELGKMTDVLDRLDDFLHDRITHVVTLRVGKIYVLPIAEALQDDEDKWRPDLKLITLFGNSRRDLAWKINEYKDGSGHNIEIWPATSEAEACTIAKQKCVELIPTVEKYALTQLIESCDRWEVEVPHRLLDMVWHGKRAHMDAAVDRAQKVLDRALAHQSNLGEPPNEGLPSKS